MELCDESSEIVLGEGNEEEDGEKEGEEEDKEDAEMNVILGRKGG